MYPKENAMNRESFFSGSFYPGSGQEIRSMFDVFENAFQDEKKLLEIGARVVIVPHAGYVYSGFTASLAYRILAKSSVKKVLVIGPSHHHYFEGVSIGDFERVATPFGELRYEKALAETLREKYGYLYEPQGHAEHSTEVQFPFIRAYMGDASLLEAVYGKCGYQDLEPLIEEALNDEGFGVIISTDLSHFYDLESAQRLDSVCLEGVVQESVEMLKSGCEACGKLGVMAMVEVAKKRGLKPTLLDYRTSADASGDKSRVVGYMSAAFTDH